MKISHAAALALVVGWLLMEPPYRTLPAPPGSPPGTYIRNSDMTAPCSQWTVIKTFPTEKVCHEQALAGRPAWTGIKQPFFVAGSAIGQLKVDLRCVAAEDPRLKTK
jgi:hypothetical protein